MLFVSCRLNDAVLCALERNLASVVRIYVVSSPPNVEEVSDAESMDRLLRVATVLPVSTGPAEKIAACKLYQEAPCDWPAYVVPERSGVGPYEKRTLGHMKNSAVDGPFSELVKEATLLLERNASPDEMLAAYNDFVTKEAVAVPTYEDANEWIRSTETHGAFSHIVVEDPNGERVESYEIDDILKASYIPDGVYTDLIAARFVVEMEEGREDLAEHRGCGQRGDEYGNLDALPSILGKTRSKRPVVVLHDYEQDDVMSMRVLASYFSRVDLFGCYGAGKREGRGCTHGSCTHTRTDRCSYMSLCVYVCVLETPPLKDRSTERTTLAWPWRWQRRWTITSLPPLSPTGS